MRKVQIMHKKFPEAFQAKMEVQKHLYMKLAERVLVRVDGEICIDKLFDVGKVA